MSVLTQREPNETTGPLCPGCNCSIKPGLPRTTVNNIEYHWVCVRYAPNQQKPTN